VWTLAYAGDVTPLLFREDEKVISGHKKDLLGGLLEKKRLVSSNIPV
jgi:hypothetical protein